MPEHPVRSRRWPWPLVRIVVIVLGTGAILSVSGCMERLFYHPEAGPTPLPAEHPGAEAVEFEAADGTALHGWFLPARTSHAADTAGAPTILHVHGNAGNIESHLWFTEYLPGAGFNLFIFDYRGYGQSEGAARRRDDLIADANAALEAVLRRPDVDPTRIGLYGQSLGGAIGLNLMADRPEIRAGVIESSFSGWREIAACSVARGGRPGPFARTLAWMLIRDHRRPVDAVARIDRPLLLLHGDADTLVPVEHGRRLAEAASQAELIELSGGNHNTLRETHPEIEPAVIGFFRGHLAGDAP